MDPQRAYYESLANKLILGQITEKEQFELDDWINSKVIKDSYFYDRDFAESKDALKARMLEELLLQIKKDSNKLVSKSKVYKWLPYVAASFLLITSCLVSYYYFNLNKVFIEVEKISPGFHQARLIFENGESIDLNEGQQEILNIENTVQYLQGSVVEHVQLGQKRQLLSLITPKSGQFKVTLKDGTIVWLNAESQLQYPSNFDENERVVNLIGEAYFEVARNDSKPFIVRTDGQDVRVLGTKFNLHAYPNEEYTRTTLIEGAVEVFVNKNHIKGKSNSTILVPGEELFLEAGHVTKNRVDVESSLAWKDGYIVFNERTLEEIMNEIARWYDLEIEYENVNRKARFGGKVSKYLDVKSVLKRLELTGLVHFEIIERRVVVKN